MLCDLCPQLRIRPMRLKSFFLVLLMTLTSGTACAGLSVQTVWESNSDVVADCGMRGANADIGDHRSDLTASEPSHRDFLQAIFGESGSDGSLGSNAPTGRGYTSLSPATSSVSFAWYTQSGSKVKFQRAGSVELPATPRILLPYLGRKFVPT